MPATRQEIKVGILGATGMYSFPDMNNQILIQRNRRTEVH